MRAAQSKKPKVHRGSASFTLGRAKMYRGRLAARAEKGEVVYIVHGHRKFLLQPVVEIEPIPVRPPGYFDSCYTAEEIAADNRLAKASVVRVPRDLERSSGRSGCFLLTRKGVTLFAQTDVVLESAPGGVRLWRLDSGGEARH
jgi:hypothetical protein